MTRSGPTLIQAALILLGVVGVVVITGKKKAS
jgi:hypothetical protein